MEPPHKIGLNGPKPTALKLRKDSRKIKKRAQPVIIYDVSPKIIHANPNEFMNLVQRLTGSDSRTATSSIPSNSSSIALCSSIEKAKLPLGGVGPRISPPGPIRPIPRMLFPSSLDPTPFIDLYDKDNEDFFCDIDFDQLLEDFDGGGSGDSASFSTSCTMLSPTSVEFLNELLNQ